MSKVKILRVEHDPNKMPHFMDISVSIDKMKECDIVLSIKNKRANKMK